MNILIIGSGGREHALAWKVAQSPLVERVFVAPGNAGTAMEPGVENVQVSNTGEMVDFAKRNAVGLTIVGPEQPLVDGNVDAFQEAGLPIFGPQAVAARLEGSKVYMKNILQRYDIPTARFEVCETLSDASAFINLYGAPIVVKADGLCGGKGAFVCKTQGEARRIARDLLVDDVLGEAGRRIVLEEFLPGEEASFIVMVDIRGNILPMASSQDHKARDERDHSTDDRRHERGRCAFCRLSVCRCYDR